MVVRAQLKPVAMGFLGIDGVRLGDAGRDHHRDVVLRVLEVHVEQVGAEDQPVIEQVGAGEQFIVPHRFFLEVLPLAGAQVKRHAARVVATADHRTDGPVRGGGKGQRHFGQKRREGFLVVQRAGGEHRGALAVNAVFLITQAAAEGPAVVQAVIQFTEDTVVFLGVIKARQPRQQQGFIGFGAGHIHAADAAEFAVLVTKGQARFVGQVVLLDVGVALAANAGVAFDAGVRVLRLVEQFEAVVEVIADIEDPGVGGLLPRRHGRGGVVELVEGLGGRYLAGAVAVVVDQCQLGFQPGDRAG